MNNLHDNILNKIKSGEVDMKPRWHFVLQAGLLLSGLVTVALVVLYMFSFVFFILHQSGIAFAPSFGFRGLGMFVMTSPWLLIMTSLVFLALLYLLVKQYSFSFKRPLVFTMIGVVLLSLAGSLLIQQTTMHQRLSLFSQRHGVPVFAPLYRGAEERRPEGVVVGTVTEVTGEGYVISTIHDETIIVVTTDETRSKSGADIAVGDVIMVFGDRDEESIHAFGIRPHHDDGVRPSRSMMERGGRVPPSDDMQQRLQSKTFNNKPNYDQ